jgi:signal transduction histidine kinase
VAIRIDDDGSGVPPESRDRIFEPFFTTKAKGSGLGLSIVHAIVTQHGGRIRVEDSPEGGARFVLLLPTAR